ncbi:hypothetical protein BDN72DRAFT_905945 [Pluteus cervinus]|uniref:Uncharacterized protein n=1 Tax=Pluteus cervinus TaxID=181527 RepID=A0ACD3A0W2_9AGAR|nr:hypothetical protein BDN72DRAFT_905945 [Pluteus cervinus]
MASTLPQHPPPTIVLNADGLPLPNVTIEHSQTYVHITYHDRAQQRIRHSIVYAVTDNECSTAQDFLLAFTSVLEKRVFSLMTVSLAPSTFAVGLAGRMFTLFALLASMQRLLTCFSLITPGYICNYSIFTFQSCLLLFIAKPINPRVYFYKHISSNEVPIWPSLPESASCLLPPNTLLRPSTFCLDMSRVVLALSVAQANWLSHVLRKHGDDHYGRTIFHQLDRELSFTPADVSSESDSGTSSESDLDHDSPTSPDIFQHEPRPSTPENRTAADAGSPMTVEEQQEVDAGSPIQVDVESEPTPTRRPVAKDSSRRVVPIPDSPTTYTHRTVFLESNMLQDDITREGLGCGQQQDAESAPGTRAEDERDLEGTSNSANAQHPVPEKQPLSTIARGIIAKVGELGRLLTSTNDFEEKDGLYHPEKNGNLSTLAAITDGLAEHFQDQEENSLHKLAEQCFQLEIRQFAIRFQYMLTSMLFRLSIHNEVISGKTKNEVIIKLSHQPQVNASQSKLYRYMREGAQYCLLTGAGSIYFLALMAAVTDKSELMSFTGDEVVKVAAILRCPYPDSLEGDIILNSIIPAIAFLRSRYAFLFPTNMGIPQCWWFDISETTLDCRNFLSMDQLMDSLDYDCFVKGRDLVSWAPCLEPISGSPTSLRIIPYIQRPVIKLRTNFDISLEINKKVAFDRASNPEGVENRFQWTQRERIKAGKWKKIETYARFAKWYWNNFQSGSNQWPEYWYFGKHMWIDNDLLVQGLDDQFLFLLSSGLPENIKQRLHPGIKSIFGEAYRYRDSSRDPKNPLQSLHMSFYNRYATRGPGQGPSSDPSTLSNSNSSTFIPRASTELKRNTRRYCLLQNILAPVFAFIDRMVLHHLPEVHRDLRQFVETLPGNEISPASPFSAFVINLNAATGAHRDWNDQEICVVLAITDEGCKGGELILVEPKAVIPLQNGDIIMFRSGDITHFNLHFKGCRSSLVLHSDKHTGSWVEHRNNWVYHALFSTSHNL